MIDLGGHEALWRLVPHELQDFHITLVNLPSGAPPVWDARHFTLVEADACDLRHLFADNAFDVAFSNSTIEHVGGPRRQAMFAAEVRRLAPAYWVQTPSDRFPIEAHTWVPWYWHLPDAVRRHLRRRWERTDEAWLRELDGTAVLSRRRMAELFPDGRIHVERWLGLEKSYAAYRPYQASARQTPGSRVTDGQV